MLQRDFLKLLNDHTCLSRPVDGLTVCELAIRDERQLFWPLITPWCAVRGRLFKNAGHMWRCSTSFSCLSPILTICVILHVEWLKMLRQKHKSHIINAICDLRNPGCHSGAFKNLFRRPGLRPVFPAISPIKTVLMAVTLWKSKREAFLRPLFFSPTSKITLMSPVAKRQYVGPTAARPSWCDDKKRLTWIRRMIFRMF